MDNFDIIMFYIYIFNLNNDNNYKATEVYKFGTIWQKT